MRFAFYGRVSTEDNQDPAASRNWQRSRAQALIDPVGGHIVRDFFDIGRSRSLPWRRRPEAAGLLATLRDPHRGFTAVVIGEPQRAFYGNQFGLTFPLFEHFGVQLWVPEVGGAIDPGSDAHDLVMSLYGGMSKGERNRIKIRVRAAMAAQAAIEGRYLGGRPPYGYLLADAGPHPNPAKAADGRRLHALAPDPATAPIVRRIFAEYLAGMGIKQIAERLNRDGVPCPSAHDPARNPHRTERVWLFSSVRAILTNPRYTGRQVWNRQRKEEVLLNVDDVALGHETKLRWNTPDKWIWSERNAHEPLVTIDNFERAQTMIATGGHRPELVRAPHGGRVYPLTGLIECVLCGRLMVASRNHDRNYYRCWFPTRYAAAARPDHPTSLYLREDKVIEPVDQWLTQIFTPANLTATLTTLRDAQADDTDQAAIAAAQATIADCTARLTRYRAALDAGTDPHLVSAWIQEVTAARAAAQATLRTLTSKPVLTHDEIALLVASIQDVMSAFRAANEGRKAEIYRQVGLKIAYNHAKRSIRLSASPSGSCTKLCPRGDLNPHALYGH
jgi:site-specific DNA recombinase